MPLRIGLITDIHHGPDVDVRLGSAAPELLEKFTRRMRNDFHPDLIVDLGDRTVLLVEVPPLPSEIV